MNACVPFPSGLVAVDGAIALGVQRGCRTSGDIAECLHKEAGEAWNVGLSEPEGPNTPLVVPDAEDHEALVGVPGGTKTMSAFVGEMVPCRESLNSTHGSKCGPAERGCRAAQTCRPRVCLSRGDANPSASMGV